MAYRVIYGEETVSFSPGSGHRILRIRVLTAVFFLTFALFVRLFWPAGANALREILLPGTPSLTQSALDNCIMEIQNGESVGQALTVFCQQILNHG